MFRKSMIIGMVVVFLIASTGCAALLSGGRGKISMTSNPSGAEVWVNGQKMGQTPCSIRLKTKGEYNIVVKKDGYKEQLFRATNKVGAGWIVLDVIAGLVPVIIDAATGSWYVFNEKSFNAELEKTAGMAAVTQHEVEAIPAAVPMRAEPPAEESQP